MDKAEVANVLEEIGTILELQGENRFRSQAYMKAARAIAQLDVSLAELVAEDKLESIPGIGATLKDKITTLVTTGRLAFHEELRAKMPPGLIQLLRLPGVGPKKAKVLFDRLGIDSLEKLKAACEAGQVADCPGFGAKSQDKILQGLAFAGESGERVRLDQAILVADEIVAALKKVKGVRRLEVCGSIRRCRETCKDVDLLAVADDPAKLMEAFVGLRQARQVTGHGETKSSIVATTFTESGKRITLNCDLRVVPEEAFPFALNYFTGSKDHNVLLRQRAIQRGLKLNEYELAGPSKWVRAREEADIYEALGLDYVPPELRENTGEMEAAVEHRLPHLVEAKDLVGIFHCHTDWSDGGDTLEEMARAAKKLGYKYLGIADHSQSLTIANGLDPARVRRQQKEIDDLNAKLRGIHLFKGIECDILADGRLDYDEEILASFDYLVASVHSHFNQTEEEMTRRILRAVRHPRVTMLGHATGRLLLRREGYKVDLEKVLRACAESGTMVEINADPHRLDLDWVHCKRARALGVKLVINPDAHSTRDLTLTRWGVNVARRGWLEKADVFNTLSCADVKKHLDARKAAASR